MLKDNGVVVRVENDYFISDEELVIFFQFLKRYSLKWSLAASLIAFGAGFRISECMAINLADFRNDYSSLTFREAKTNKVRTVPLIESVREAVRLYVDLEGHRLEGGFLFPTYSSSRTPFMGRDSAVDVFWKIRQVLGVKFKSFHDRYSFVGHRCLGCRRGFVGEHVPLKGCPLCGGVINHYEYFRYRVGWHSLRRWFETHLHQELMEGGEASGNAAYVVKVVMGYSKFEVLNSYLDKARIVQGKRELLEGCFGRPARVLLALKEED